MLKEFNAEYKNTNKFHNTIAINTINIISIEFYSPSSTSIITKNGPTYIVTGHFNTIMSELNNNE